MRNRLLIFLILVFFLGVYISSSSYALILEKGIEPLRTEFGAYPMSMGNAVTAVPHVSSVFYNPGAIPWAQGVTLTIQDTENISIGEVYPFLPGHHLGFGLVASSYTGIPLQGGGEANYTARLLTCSYGARLSYIPFIGRHLKNTSFGVKFKSILSTTFREEGQPDKSTLGWDIDVGGLWIAEPWLTLGVWGKNILSKQEWGTGELRWDSGEKEAISGSAIVGGLVKISGMNGLLSESEEEEIFVSVDFDVSPKLPRSSLLRLGSEWLRKDMYAVRVGICQDWDGRGVVTNVTGGLGVMMGDFNIDLGYKNDPLLDTGIIQFSINYSPRIWMIEERIPKPKPPEEAEVPVEYKLAEVIVYEEYYTITGEAEEDIEIYVNDNRAYVDDEGKYAVVVPLYPGKNLILVEGEIEERKVLHSEYKVFRKAKILIAGESKLIKEENKIRNVKKKLEKQRVQLKKELKRKIRPERKVKVEKRVKEIDKKIVKVKKEEESYLAERKEFDERKEIVENLVTMGIVEVTPEVEFELEAPVSRGELVSWLIKAAEIPLPKVEKDVYLDVSKDHSYAPYIKAATDLGLVLGYPDGDFRPEAFLTVEEGEKIFKKFGVIK